MGPPYLNDRRVVGVLELGEILIVDDLVESRFVVCRAYSA